MSEMIHRSVEQAISQGWQFVAMGNDSAVLSVPARHVSSTGVHAVNAVLSILTCGAWLIPWAIIAAVDSARSIPAQTLIIREIDGVISRKVIKV